MPAQARRTATPKVLQARLTMSAMSSFSALRSMLLDCRAVNFKTYALTHASRTESLLVPE